MTIGIMGGFGSYATLDAFGRLLDAFPAAKEWDRPRVIIDNYCTIPSRVRAILYDENVDEVVCKMSESAAMLLRFGCTHIMMACGTAYVFAPRIIERVPQFATYNRRVRKRCTKGGATQSISYGNRRGY